MHSSNEPAIISSTLPKPGEDDTIAIDFTRWARYIPLILLLLFSTFCFFVVHDVLVPLVSAGILLFIFVKALFFKRYTWLVINKHGIRHKKKFYSWDTIRDTYICHENDEDNNIRLVLDTNYGIKKINTVGLDASVNEIAHYVTCFRTKSYQ